MSGEEEAILHLREGKDWEGETAYFLYIGEYEVCLVSWGSMRDAQWEVAQALKRLLDG